MDIISTRVTPNPSSFRFKIGGAALVFEEGRKWRQYFENMIPGACQAVRKNRIRSTNRDDRIPESSRDPINLGDILYMSLVHAISQMIDAFVQARQPLCTGQVDLQVAMNSMSVWKQDAELEAIVEVAARFLSLYKHVNPSDPHLKARLLMEFEVVWREIIDPFLSVQPLLSRHFSDGGYLSQELLGPDLYTILTNIRKQVIQNRERERMAASSSGAGISLTG